MNSSDQIQAERDGLLWADTIENDIGQTIHNTSSSIERLCWIASTKAGRPLVQRDMKQLTNLAEMLAHLMRGLDQ